MLFVSLFECILALFECHVLPLLLLYILFDSKRKNNKSQAKQQANLSKIYYLIYYLVFYFPDSIDKLLEQIYNKS